MFPSMPPNFVVEDLTNQEDYFINDVVPQFLQVAQINAVAASVAMGSYGEVPKSEINDSPAFVLIGCAEVPAIDDTLVMDFYLIQEEPIRFVPRQQEELTYERATYGIGYSSVEEDILKNLYGSQEPTLQISLQSIARAPKSQRSIEFTEVSYDSLSSLEEASSEAFTISTLTGSTTGLIITPEERISDVGGLSGPGRDREIINTGGARDTVATTGY